MTQRGRRAGGQFTSQTAARTIVDPIQQATVTELEDGSKILSALSPTSEAPTATAVLDAPTYEEQDDGSIVITAPANPLMQEAVRMDEPRIFTCPTMPNVTLAGTRYKIGPGQWKQYPVNRSNYIRFVNGHCAARTDQQAEKILKHFPTIGRNQRVWEEPAPLLSEDKARERGLEPPFLFYNSEGKVAFWTYHRDALNAFNRNYMGNAG